MATTVDSSSDHRSPQTNISQQVNLHGFSQTDLYNLSLSSSSASHRRKEASVAPKIDRSVFNESAGSRRQTYTRLRLLPRNKQPSASASATSSKALRIPLRIPEAVDEENSQIIALLQGLFGVESLRNANANANREGGGDEDCLVPVQVEFNHSLLESSAAEFQSIPIDVVDTGQKKRKRGRPRKNENYGIIIKEEEPKKVDAAAIPPPPPAPVIVNEKGLAVDVVGLGEVGDPFGEEVKRRTQGLETHEQLLEFLEGLNGEWGSQRKKRRIVPASDLGDLLPAGWKIVLSLQRRAGRASVICRRYVSPNGHQFESCKEVSVYLLSLFGVQDISHLKSNYTDGSQHFSSNINNASGAGWFPPGVMKTDANASYLHLAGTSIHSLHEKQAIASSSIESEKLDSSDGNFNNDLNLDCKLGETTGSAFRDFEHQTEDKCLPLKADKNDANSVKGCSVDEDRIRNVRNEKLVGAIEASNAACNLYIPLDFVTPSSNNNGGICQFSDEINDVTSISDMSNFASQDRNIGCYETVFTGNEQAHVDSNGHGLSVRLVEDHRQKIGFESSILAPNHEGKIFAVNNLEDRDLISSLEDMEISDGKSVKDNNQQIVSTRYQSEYKDLSTIVKLDSSINSTDKTQTSMLKDSAEGKCFDSDLPSPFIDDKTCVRSDYINNVSLSTFPQDASESGVVVVAPDLKVAEDVVTSCVQEMSSSTDQNCKMDYLLHNMSTLDDNEHPSAFDNNMSNISAGTVDALKAVDTGCKKPQLAIVSCSDAVDAYTSASTMQGRSQGCISVPLAGSILNRFNEQSDNGVNNAHKSCSPEKAKSEAEMFQTNSIDMPKFK